MIIGIDFDGTCVTHEFPKIGKDIGAIPVLRRLVESGHLLVLFTMRSDIKEVTSNEYDIHKTAGNYLTEAVEWFNDKLIPLYGININPTQHTWTTSPKAYCHLYIDDAALGAPLLTNLEISSRPFINWLLVEDKLEQLGILPSR
jgi:hypothetical protein